jgi:hypothetical protein
MAPIANAGPDQTVDEQSAVTLDGSGSADSDGMISVYEWTQLAGTAVTLNETSPEMPTFAAPDLDVDETLTFQLIVTDDDGASSNSDTVDISVVADVPPPAAAPQVALQQVFADALVRRRTGGHDTRVCQ